MHIGLILSNFLLIAIGFLMDNRGEIIIYQTEEGLTKINVNLQTETV